MFSYIIIIYPFGNSLSADLIIFIFLHNIIVLAVTKVEKLPDFTKFLFVFELQRLQDHIYPLI